MLGTFANSKRLEKMRTYLKVLLPALGDLDQSERDDFARDYWLEEISDRLRNGNFESAWHCLSAAAIGEHVFSGPHRICRPNLENLPVGQLVCRAGDVIELVELLYDEIPTDAPIDWTNIFQDPPSWQMQSGFVSIELLDSGNPVFQMLAALDTTKGFIASFQAMAISTYANNYRRLKVAA